MLPSHLTNPIRSSTAGGTSIRRHVTLLVVSFRSKEDVIALLEDFERIAPGAPIIVVDNASADGTKESVAERFPKAALVANTENVGFARGVNLGLRRCTTDYVLLANPDIRLEQPEAVQIMLDCLSASPQIAAVGPLQFKRGPRGLRLNDSWSYRNLPSLRVYVGKALGLRRRPAEPIRVMFLNAGCLLLRLASVLEVGLLSEKYFMYGEEPDLFLKLKLHDYQSYLHPGAWVVHHREHSLSTLPSAQRLRLKVRGLMNVVDAIARGFFQLGLKAAGARPARVVPAGETTRERPGN